MNSNRHSCIPKARFTYTSNLNTLRPSPKEIPLRNILASTVTPGFPQSYQSYQPSRPYQARGISLPPQNPHNASLSLPSDAIRIEQGPFSNQRARKHKIFGQRWSPTRSTGPELLQSPQKVSTGLGSGGQQKAEVAVQCSSSLSPEKEADRSMIDKQAEILATRAIQSFLQRSSEEKEKLSREQKRLQEQRMKLEEERRRKGSQKDNINDNTYQKIIERLIQGNSDGKVYMSPSTLSKKDREIQYLKMQVERLQRCDRLSKQNESLYRKLVDVLKDNSYSANTSFINSLKKQITPSPKKQIPNLGSGLHQERESIPLVHLGLDNIIVNKKGLDITTKTSPQRSPYKEPKSPLNMKSRSPERITEHSKVVRQSKNLMLSNTLTFNHEERRQSHEKRFKPEQWRGAVKLRRTINESIQNRAQIVQAPITMRLGEINRQLQRSMNYDNRPRSSSKPHRVDYDDLFGRPVSSLVPKRMYMY